jgi:AraC-like DNA-binding protein
VADREAPMNGAGHTSHGRSSGASSRLTRIERAMTAREVAHLRRAKDLADRSYAQPLDVEALTRRAQCSPWHFSRRFKEAFGETRTSTC